MVRDLFYFATFRKSGDLHENCDELAVMGQEALTIF
jgi:hypothetical protein